MMTYLIRLWTAKISTARMTAAVHPLITCKIIVCVSVRTIGFSILLCESLDVSHVIIIKNLNLEINLIKSIVKMLYCVGL